VSRVTVVHAVPDASGAPRVVEKVLVPFDFTRFPLSHGAVPPLITLPPRVLLAHLAEEYVFAELCEALMLSFAAENEARMRAMIMARTNVATTLDGLVARSRQLRQEVITEEIMELASGSAAGVTPR
jgi:F-type H+-transporting ATPase subunit gamma